MRHYKAFLVAGILLLICIFAFFPTSYERVVRQGTDRFYAHHALFGKRVKSVTETATTPLSGVGVILTARNVHEAPFAHVSIVVDGRGEVAVGDVPVGADDEFAWLSVSRKAVGAGERYTVEVSAPSASSDAPVGVRFDEENKELAFAVKERVAVWEYILRWKEAYPELARKVFMTLFGGVGLAVLLYSIDFFLVSPRRGFVWAGSLCLLFIFAIAIRVPLANSLDSAYGGDAFNYLLKSRALIDGNDPFSADPRKAPLYSFLAAPGLVSIFDAVIWERWVSMLAGAGAVVLVPLFLRRFGVPYSLALAGGALLAVNRDFQFESVQGLSNTLYAFLVLLSAYLFLIGRPYLVAVFSALATLTRYEGGAVAAVLVPASWFIDRLKFGKIVRTMIPVIILLAIPFIMSPFSHSLGVRTLEDIRSDEGLYVAYSFDDFFSNWKSFRTWFGRLWLLTEHIGKPFAWLFSGVCLGVLGMLVRTPSRSPLSKGEKSISSPHMRGGEVGSLLFPYVLVIFILAIVIRDSSEQAAYLIGLFALLAGIGIVGALVHNPKRSIWVLVMIVVQIIAITAILPKTRYYLPVIPFLTMAIIGGIYWLISGKNSQKRLFGGLLCACVLASLAYADAQQALPGQVSEYNEKSAGQTVLLNAARYMKNNSGIIAAADGSDLQFRTYLPKKRVIIFPDSLRDTAAQYKILKDSRVAFISDTTENPYFEKLIQAMPDKFQEVATFTTKWSDISSRIYRVY